MKNKFLNPKSLFLVLVMFGIFGLFPHQFSHIKFRAKFILFILFIIISVGMYAKSSWAADWYVDNIAGGANNGTNWTNAWQSFSNINWNSVSCGDTVYISGGPTGNKQEYSERLKIESKNCTAEAPITVTVGADAAHNGTVQITGMAGLGTGIYFQNSQWITIDGQGGGDSVRHIEIYQKPTCTNCISVGVELGGNTGQSKSAGIKLKYLHIHDVGTIDNDYHAAVKFDYEDNSYNHDNELSYSLIEKTIDCIDVFQIGNLKPSSYGGTKIHHNTISCYDDGIQASVSADIYDNDFIRGNYVGKGHPDGLQIYGSYVRIFNNYFHGFLDQPSGNSVVYWEPDGGENMNINEHQPSDFWLYNNVFYETGTASSSVFAVSLGLSDTRFTSLKNVYVLNNSFTGAFPGALTVAWGTTTLDKNAVTDFYIMNNAFYNANKSGAVMLGLDRPSFITTPVDYGGYRSGTSIIFDYNSYYSDDNTNIAYLGSWLSYNSFRTQCPTCQLHGTISNPLMKKDTLIPLSGSPLIDAGSSFPSSYFTTDFLNTIRLQGSAWDIGAYEYTGSSNDTTPPAAPSGLTVN